MRNDKARSGEFRTPWIQDTSFGYRFTFGRKSDFESLPIPKGMRPKAQCCEARATLGKQREKRQPQRGCDQRRKFTKTETPLGFCSSDPLPQGSSCLATLGSVAESRWDSGKRHSS